MSVTFLSIVTSLIAEFLFYLHVLVKKKTKKKQISLQWNHTQSVVSRWEMTHQAQLALWQLLIACCGTDRGETTRRLMDSDGWRRTHDRAGSVAMGTSTSRKSRFTCVIVKCIHWSWFKYKQPLNLCEKWLLLELGKMEKILCHSLSEVSSL